MILKNNRTYQNSCSSDWIAIWMINRHWYHEYAIVVLYCDWKSKRIAHAKSCIIEVDGKHTILILKNSIVCLLCMIWNKKKTTNYKYLYMVFTFKMLIIMHVLNKQCITYLLVIHLYDVCRCKILHQENEIPSFDVRRKITLCFIIVVINDWYMKCVCLTMFQTEM